MKEMSHKKTSIVGFPLYEVPGVVIFMKKDSKMVGLWVI